MKIRLILSSFLICCITQIQAQADTGVLSLESLKTEYLSEPLGIDVTSPRFSWQLGEDISRRNITQKRYRITVFNENQELVWDSGLRDSSNAHGVYYQGVPLTPKTKYEWKLWVEDQQGYIAQTSSWFETGIMSTSPDNEGWMNAEWIGSNELVFNAQYLTVFKLDYALQLDEKSRSTKASILFGGNDPRLLDVNKNIQGVESEIDHSYIEVELDLSSLPSTQNAQLHIYRQGYSKTDDGQQPFASFDIPDALINGKNKYDSHQFEIHAVFGLIQLYYKEGDRLHLINKPPANAPRFGGRGLNLNPVGSGNNYICFPALGEVGFKMKPDQHARFSKFEIRHFRAPSNSLFSEEGQSESVFDTAGLSFEKGVYSFDHNSQEVFVLKDVSFRGTPYLRTDFSVESKPIRKARVYTTAQGVYELYLNGKRVSENYFEPGLTQYNKTLSYQTYDVTEMIEENNNAFGAILSEGWWSGNITYEGENWNYFGDRQAIKTLLQITYEDGTEQYVSSTPDTWKYTHNGPVRYGSFFQGEVYDATREAEIALWNTAMYDDYHWSAAERIEPEHSFYLAEDFNYDTQQYIGKVDKGVRVVATLEAKSVEEVRPGVYVYDMGQNMVGFPEIIIYEGEEGEKITMRYAEVRYPELEEYQGQEGMIMLENLRAALVQDEYIQKSGYQLITPRFTFHGFRYLEITGIDKALPLEQVKAKVLSSVSELSSEFVSSNKLVNRLWENVTWSLRSNFLSIPTDTPARNERMGWSGDINVFSRSATYLAEVGPFLNRHMRAMRDIQSAEGRFTDVAPVGGGFGGTLWGSAGIVIPWEVYRQYGDIEILKDNYSAMSAYLVFLDSKIDPDTGIIQEGPLGDWLSPEAYKNDPTLFWTTYYIYNLEVMQKVAALLGHKEDELMYAQKYQAQKAFFNSVYVDQNSVKTLHQGNQSLRFGPPLPDHLRKSKGDTIDTQASYAIPLRFNAFHENLKHIAAQNLVRSIERSNIDELEQARPPYSLMTGFIGTASINQALSKYGYHDVAYRLLQQEHYPSWLYPVINGATTIWERLNSYTIENGFGGNNAMNSFNHYSFGAVTAWMYETVLGIKPEEENPAFKSFVLQPVPDPTGQMLWAKGYFNTVYGQIVSAWQWVDEEKKLCEFIVKIPSNTEAKIRFPLGVSVEEFYDNKFEPVKDWKVSSDESWQDWQESTYGSGIYKFKVQY